MHPRAKFSLIESWALRVVGQASSGAKLEDARVELKAGWIPPEKAARRLAGHANAAAGAQILWVVGVDETVGAVGVDATELQNWWERVRSCFDGIAPDFTDLRLEVGGKALCALCFDTTRAPYVVKNPMFGQAGGGPIAFEVPWRDGTSVRSASRNDLVKLLAPVVTLPEVEVLRGHIALREVREYPSNEVSGFEVSVSCGLYMIPRSAPTVIPFHRCACVVVDTEGNQLDLNDLRVSPPYTVSLQRGGSAPDSVTMEATSSELIAQGPGKCEFLARCVLPTILP